MSVEDETEKRQRTLTDKGEELYHEHRQKLYDRVVAANEKLIDIINAAHNVDSTDTAAATVHLGSIRTEYNVYSLASEDFVNFLMRAGTLESKEELVSFSSRREAVKTSYKRTVHKLREITGASESSKRSSVKRAQAEAAHVRLQFAKKEAELRKQMAIYEEKQQVAALEEEQRMAEKRARAERIKREFEADMTLLQEEKEAATAEAEAAYQEGEENVEPPFVNVPIQEPSVKVQEYLTALDSRSSREDSKFEFSVEKHQPVDTYKVSSDTEILTTFLLRKDIMPQRLKRFNEKPQCFGMWKATFKSVMRELKATPSEEIDFLLNNLGSESKMWAENICAANTCNADRGLRLIWERLDDCYGSPEQVEESIKNRIESFPQLSNRDNRKLFELYDLLAEIESLKQDTRFALQFAFYDSSTGVNAIVHKLPYGIQQKWVSTATKYKRDHSVVFPPFRVFVGFVQNVAKMKNDPAFLFEQSSGQTSSTSKSKHGPAIRNKPRVSTQKTQISDNSNNVVRVPVNETIRCPIHKANHKLCDCNTFANMTWEEKRAFLREKGICFKCLSSTEHVSAKCSLSVSCEKCTRKNHLTIMHRDINVSVPTNSPSLPYGGEGTRAVSQHNAEAKGTITVASRCTSLCGQDFRGRSCGKIVLVDVSHGSRAGQSERVYAIIDDQSNRSLIGPELCDKLNVSSDITEYTLTSCSGNTVMAGRRVTDLTVTSYDGTTRINLPTLIECDAIPQNISEIPTPEVAANFSHLKPISSSIPQLNQQCGIQLLIGRDLPAAHHVVDQLIGPRDLPFALRLSLGWVIIGEVCLGKVHKPETVRTYFTHINREGRGSIFEPCNACLTVKEKDGLGSQVFKELPDDNKVGLSVEDREFLTIMDHEFVKDDSGLWTAPLPFKMQRPSTPLTGNRDQVFKRAIGLKKNLEKNPTKCQHMVQFMEKVLRNNAAEKAPDDQNDSEKWYLPLFGVYHPRKPNQIRGVFDSSIAYKGNSLNDRLLAGPNLTNSLLGVLLRFRRDKYAVSADVEQMFYRFLVNAEHRNFLRFFWFENNSPEHPLVEFQMRVHVFGNKPSPAVATYGLRKAVEEADPDVQQFFRRDFYVDDALTSKPSRESAISLLNRTRTALHDHGKIHLHKIASNDLELMNQFPKEELDTSLKDLDLDEELPSKKSLGLTWDIGLDMFVFAAPSVDNPFTRRGLLSAVNSIFDPCGFVAPFSLAGKVLLREASATNSAWDDPLPSSFRSNWIKWKSILEQLHGYNVPRMYLTDSLSLTEEPQVLIFSDASETAIAAAAYVTSGPQEDAQTGFVMGKAKLAPKGGHSIPRLELCAAVLAVEVGRFIAEQLDIPPIAFRFFTDSKVVLGYICNRTRRFYTYVSNRVAQIHAFCQPDQWSYIPTELNPADAATRFSLDGIHEMIEKWHAGPQHVKTTENSNVPLEDFPLLFPEEDMEVRPDVVIKITSINRRSTSIVSAYERFSQWKKLVAAFSTLIHIARTFSHHSENDCSGWHICKESSSVPLQEVAERLILTELQKQHFSEEIKALQVKKPIRRSSPIISLSPKLDEFGMLRVGGRIQNLSTSESIEIIHPLIIPRGHVATLLVRHCHELTAHQGRHLTEGAIRSKGYWIIGGKRLVSSLLHNCVTCRRLRGPLIQQKMADLPEDRLTSSPPFTFVGVDVFGPWTVLTRRTRGGSANSKRWAAVFTCLYCRAVHIELLEEMSTSSFINAMRRFIAIRGKVTEFRSDRGTNFVGAVTELGINAIYVEDDQMRTYLTDNKISWCFNPPHASHFGGVWERMIGVARRILDAMLLNVKKGTLTHEVLSTFMAEVTAIMNSRPLVPVSSDSEEPFVLSPSVLLTQKASEIVTDFRGIGVKDMYRSQWRMVQLLADTFWKRWKNEFLSMLQSRRKWVSPSENLKVGDVVLLREKECVRNDWPVGLVTRVFPSEDNLVRKLELRVIKNDKPCTYVRPVAEVVRLVTT